MLVLAPNLRHIANLIGFKVTYAAVLSATVAMTIVCVAGTIISCRKARARAARDMAELTRPPRM